MERWLNLLERRFGRYAVPHLALFVVTPKIIFLLKVALQPSSLQPMMENFVLVPALVLEGELWRLFTFLVIPPTFQAIWFLLYAYLTYLYCSGLEQAWGAFRLNVYILIAWFATVVSTFLAYFLNEKFVLLDAFYVETTLFLAFAAVYPEFVFQLFFILPVKVKYLAMVAWAMAGFQFMQGGWSEVYQYAHRVVLLGIYCNYLLFFGARHYKYIRDRIEAQRRRKKWQEAMRKPPRHQESDLDKH
ncbi:MAG: hypothetical protein V3T77_07245 [Planctomycetota bacterium]